MMRIFRWLDRALRRVLLAAVRGYQKYLGWLLGGHCRFVPSCSHYAEEALQRGPLMPAIGLIVWRLVRCQPLCKGGFDPVPRWMGRDRKQFVGEKDARRPKDGGSRQAPEQRGGDQDG